MTNIIQYLDICADTLKRLRDQGITPTQMVIDVDADILHQAHMVIQGQYVTARHVESPFKAEVMNRGLISFARNGFIFHLALKQLEIPMNPSPVFNPKSKIIKKDTL